MEAAAGAGAGAAPAEGASLRSFQATIRYVLNDGRGVTMEDFVWSVVPEGKPMTVYRGQAGASTKAIAGDRTTPLEIKTDRGKPLSTSKMLTSKIETFAAVPEGSAAVGRLFAIELQPGVRYAPLRDQTPDEYKSYAFSGKDKAAATRRTKAAFAFLDAELPDGHPLKGADKLKAKTALFFNFLSSEREVLLDPRTIQFVADPSTKTPETWDRPLVPAQSFDLTATGKQIETPESAAENRKPWEKEYISHPVNVYKTYAIPKPKGGRHRTVRRRRHGTRKHRRHQ